MPHTLLALLAAPLLALPLARAKPLAVHAAVHGSYDDVDWAQLERMGERIAKVNPDLDLLQIHRKRVSGVRDRPSFELRELGFDVEDGLKERPEPIALLVVQASPQDYDHFWSEFDAGRFPFEALRHRLAPEALVIFAGASNDIGGDRARAVMAAFGNTAGSLLVATSPGHVYAPKIRVLGKTVELAASALAAGVGGAVMVNLPPDAILPEVGAFLGTGAWVMAEVYAKFHFGALAARTKKTGQKEFGFTEVFSAGQVMRGFALAGGLVGILYLGPEVLDWKFAAWSLGYSAVAAGFVAHAKAATLLGFLAPRRFGFNRGRLFTTDDAGETTSVEVSTEDETLYRCRDNLTAL